MAWRRGDRLIFAFWISLTTVGVLLILLGVLGWL